MDYRQIKVIGKQMMNRQVIDTQTDRWQTHRSMRGCDRTVDYQRTAGFGETREKIYDNLSINIIHDIVLDPVVQEGLVRTLDKP